MTQANDFQVIQERDGAIFRLVQPARLNAITLSMLHGLSDCIDRLEADRARFLVITGEGERAFSAGTDLNEINNGGEDAQLSRRSDFARRLFHRLSQAPLVSVAALNGLAYGGGLELAMACNFRVAAPHVRLSLPEIKLGVLPSYGGTQFLPALIGQSRALDLMLTGRAIDVTEAVNIGLINRIAEPGASVVDAAQTLARSITGFSRAAIAGMQACVAGAGPVVTEAGMRLEAEMVAQVSSGPDAREGIAAFLEKRPPNFQS